MLTTELDHLVVTAPSLTLGAALVQAQLGVSLEPGGEHVRMGTHNQLLRIGETSYLEVIAVNPAAVAPECPRWFELDRPGFSAVPRLATWVARTSGIEQALSLAGFEHGRVERMRRGSLEWQISLSADGELPFQGVCPTLIQWETGHHPATRLARSGVTLVRLEGVHPGAGAIRRMLGQIGFQGCFEVSEISPDATPGLVATFETPTGLRQLRGCHDEA